MIVRKPVGENLVLVRIARTEHREQSGIQIRQSIEILRIDLLDPLAIFLGVPTVANADEQGSVYLRQLRRCPGERADSAVRPGMDQLSKRITSEPKPRTQRIVPHRQQRWQPQQSQRRPKRPNQELA